jgi:hypothetical protein
MEMSVKRTILTGSCRCEVPLLDVAFCLPLDRVDEAGVPSSVPFRSRVALRSVAMAVRGMVRDRSGLAATSTRSARANCKVKK